MAKLVDRLYAAAPVWAQSLGITVYGLMWKRRRFGGEFPRFLEGFIQRDRFSADQWRDYQTGELRRLLLHTFDHVARYRAEFQAAGVQRDDLSRFELGDLPRLPILTKEHLRRHHAEYIADSVNAAKLYTYHTSGSTGTPIPIRYSPATHQGFSAAYEVRCRQWAGVNNTMSRATIGGRIVVPKANSKPPFWRYNRVERQLYMSAFHLAPANVPHYVAALHEYRPDYLAGYAMSHFLLARLIKELGLKAPKLRAVLASSEKMTVEMRTVIEEVFQCPVFDSYASVEGCCLAAECECHRLHVSPDVGIIEIVDDAGQPVAPGQPGTVLATGLLNFAQPLIRFRLGDVASFSSEPCRCGRAMPVLEELVGRLEDVVIGPDGREMVRFHGIFCDLPNVREGQIVQETTTLIRVRLVIAPDFDESERETIRQRFRTRLGAVEVRFEYVGEIERTAQGKFRAVISKVPRQGATARPATSAAPVNR